MKKFIILIITFLLIVINLNVVNAEEILDCNKYLRYGSTGENVKTLQNNLNKITTCNLAVDGIYGKLTKACVVDFQKKNNLEEDGITGPLTCKKIKLLYNIEKNTNYGVVIPDKLNVRKTASTSSTILTQLTRGTVIKLYSTKNINNETWYKVKIKKSDNTATYAYVSADYVKKTAIVLNIEEQNLKLYKDGKVELNVPVITGFKDKHDTPTGIYNVSPNTNSRDEVLRGKNDDGSNYASPVSYWMPFVLDRGIGFHDATWRDESTFTTETYKSNGSHGCVNMKFNDAKILYENITSDTTVIVK